MTIYDLGCVYVAPRSPIISSFMFYLRFKTPVTSLKKIPPVWKVRPQTKNYFIQLQINSNSNSLY